MCERVELRIGRDGGSRERRWNRGRGGGWRVRFLHLIIFKAYIPILYFPDGR